MEKESEGNEMNFQIQRRHWDRSLCQKPSCSKIHTDSNWTVVGDGVWQSDHATYERAEQAAFAYRAMEMHNATRNEIARDAVRHFLEGRHQGMTDRLEGKPSMRFDIATPESMKYADGYFRGYHGTPAPRAKAKKGRTK